MAFDQDDFDAMHDGVDSVLPHDDFNDENFHDDPHTGEDTHDQPTDHDDMHHDLDHDPDHDMYSSIHIGQDEYIGQDGIYYPPTYDPGSGTEGVTGDVTGNMEHWEFQGPTNECAIYAQLFALEELTGEHYEPDQLVAIAEENGWFHNGTSMEDMGKLLEHFDLKVEKDTYNIQEIEDALSEGKQVIVGLDSAEIWQEDRDAQDAILEDIMGIPGNDADHAVQVIGFDHSDPENPMVVLNDSGHPGGCGEMIPQDVFEGAWEDSGNFAVIASK